MDIIQKIVKDAWATRYDFTSIELVNKLYNIIRDDVTSDLVATNIADGLISNDVIHVVLGVMSSVEINVKLIIGTRQYGDIINLKPMIPTPLLTHNDCSWPVLNTYYHRMSLEKEVHTLHAHKNLPDLWILGIRVKKDLLKQLEPSCIPDLCVFKDGMCFTTEECSDLLPEWKTI